MTQIDQVGAAVPRRSRRKKPVIVPAEGERYTPLMSRDAHTFALMRNDRSGPRIYSAICFPGWRRV